MLYNIFRKKFFSKEKTSTKEKYVSHYIQPRGRKEESNEKPTPHKFTSLNSLYHKITKNAIPLYRNCVLCLAEKVGFEPTRRVNALRDFESRLFDHLSTSPYNRDSIASKRVFVKGNHHFSFEKFLGIAFQRRFDGKTKNSKNQKHFPFLQSCMLSPLWQSSFSHRPVSKNTRRFSSVVCAIFSKASSVKNA